jgi:DNA-binding HxlR family transcriptional regulator
MTTPTPGQPVRGSKTGRPLMALLDLLGRRWVLRILWELRDGRPLNFRALQDACGGVSPTVLNQRLKELRDSGLLELTEEGYQLTRHGASLLETLEPLDAWAKRWAKRRP